MGPLSAVPIIITFFLWGLVVGQWATINNHVMAVIWIVTAVLVLIDILWTHRTVFVRKGTVA